MIASEIYPNHHSQIKIKIKAIAILTLSTVTFLFSSYLSPYYYLGDQYFYRLFYESVNEYSSWDEKFLFHKSMLDASEPFYLLFVSSVSPYFAKDFVFSLINAGIVALGVHFILKRNGSAIVCFLLVTNFYLIVLFFSAERLKFGLFLLLISFLFQRWKRWIFMILAILSQFQIIVLVISCYLIMWFYNNETNANSRGVKLYHPLLFVVIAVAVLFFLHPQVLYEYLLPHLEGKMNAYANIGWGGWDALIKPLFFMLCSVYISRRDKLFTAMSFVPILIAAYFLGSERFAIFSFILMLFYGIGVKRGLNMFIIVPSLYFSVQGILFCIKFLENGAA